MAVTFVSWWWTFRSANFHTIYSFWLVCQPNLQSGEEIQSQFLVEKSKKIHSYEKHVILESEFLTKLSISDVFNGAAIFFFVFRTWFLLNCCTLVLTHLIFLSSSKTHWSTHYFDLNTFWIVLKSFKIIN